MKVEHYERLVRLHVGRRNFLKGAAALAAGTALTSSMGGRAFAQDNLRAQILQIPGVGKGSPTDADWQKVGELCLGPTKENVTEGEFAGVELTFMGLNNQNLAQLPVPRLPEVVGGLYRRQDQLDRPRAGRLQPPPAAGDRHRDRRFRHHRDGRSVRGRHRQQGPARRDAGLGEDPDRHGRLCRLPEAAGRDLGRQDLSHHRRRRLPHLRLPQGLLHRCGHFRRHRHDRGRRPPGSRSTTSARR